MSTLRRRTDADPRQEWIDGQLVHITCHFCHWQYQGTVGDGRQAALAHRVTDHPEAARKPRRNSTEAQVAAARKAARERERAA